MVQYFKDPSVENEDGGFVDTPPQALPLIYELAIKNACYCKVVRSLLQVVGVPRVGQATKERKRKNTEG